jgi:predicted NUDIX family NTP pyrophosphohydrolase
VATSKISAGVLVFRTGEQGLEVLLAHPGGPFFRNKDEGGWTIPKGEPDEGEAFEAAAVRELAEETGVVATGPLLPLGEVRQKGGKTVHAWACRGELPEGWVPTSSTFEMEWPPRSGRQARFPEIDRAEMFPIEVARRKINPAQAELIERLVKLVG